MQYKIEDNFSPVHDNQAYVWFADFPDKETVYEFDNDQKESMFDYTDFAGHKSFGLIGCGKKMQYSADGSFVIDGKEFKTSVTIDGRELDVAGAEKTPVSFKIAHADANVFGGQTKADHFIDSFSFGYKTMVEGIEVQVLYFVPVTGDGQAPFFGVKVVSPGLNDYKVIIGEKETSLEYINNGIYIANVFVD